MIVSMDGIKLDLPTKLLNSPNEKVAAAAKRIFLVDPTPSPMKSIKKPTTVLVSKFGTVFSADIQEAATTVLAMAPKRNLQDSVITSIVSSSANLTPISNNALNTTQSPQFTAQKPTTKPTISSLPPLTPSMKKQAMNQERLRRSRERNKMHARKTRQRKKEHMTLLESRVEDLKKEQLNIKLRIKEKITANILLGMFASSGNDAQSSLRSSKALIDPKIDALLKRNEEDTPDASKIPDLPALILPGNHSKRRKLEETSTTICAEQEYPNDGIDYELLGKDRTSCSPEELDKIRKERNRMHAKRTRDRKRIFMEEMEKIIKQLESENELLHQHLCEITSDSIVTASSGRVTPNLNESAQGPCCPPVKVQPQSLDHKGIPESCELNVHHKKRSSEPQKIDPGSSICSSSSTVSMSPPPSFSKQGNAPPTCSQILHSRQVPSSITTDGSGREISC